MRRASEPHRVSEPSGPVAYLAWCLGQVAEAVATSHPCRGCGAFIPNRYPFDVCTRCAMRANETAPEVQAWRAERRKLARERITALKAKLARGDECGTVHRLVPVALALMGATAFAFLSVCRHWFSVR